MTKDDIIRMALEVRDPEKVDPRQGGFWVLTLQELEAFANLVAAHKAEVITAEAYRRGYEAGAVADLVYADAIRARGNT
jgi:hypothetical protein